MFVHGVRQHARVHQRSGRELRAHVPGRGSDDDSSCLGRVDQCVHNDGASGRRRRLGARRRPVWYAGVHSDGRRRRRRTGGRRRSGVGRRDGGGRHAVGKAGYGQDVLGGRDGQTADVRHLRDRQTGAQARRMLGRRDGRQQTGAGAGDASHADGRGPEARQPFHADRRGRRQGSAATGRVCRPSPRSDRSDGRRPRERDDGPTGEECHSGQTQQFVPSLHGRTERADVTSIHVQDSTAEASRHARSQPESVDQTGHVH